MAASNMSSKIKTNLPAKLSNPSQYGRKIALAQLLPEGAEAGDGEIVLVVNDDNKTRFAVNKEIFMHYSLFARKVLGGQANGDEEGEGEVRSNSEEEKIFPFEREEATFGNVQLFCTWLKRHERVHHSKQPSPMPMPWTIDSLFSDKWDIAFIRQHLVVEDRKPPSSASQQQQEGKFQKVMQLALFATLLDCRPLMEMLSTYLCWQVKILGNRPDDAVGVVSSWFAGGQEMTEEQKEAMKGWLQENLKNSSPQIRRSMFDPVPEFDNPPLRARDESTTPPAATTTTGGGLNHVGGAKQGSASPLLLPSPPEEDAPRKASLIKFPISNEGCDDDWIQFLPANFEFLCQWILMQGQDEEGNPTFPVPLAVNLIQNLYEPVFDPWATPVWATPVSGDAAQAGDLGLLYSFLTPDRIQQIEDENDEGNFRDGVTTGDRPPLFSFIYTCLLTQPDASDFLLQFIQSTKDGSIWKKTAACVLRDVLAGGSQRLINDQCTVTLSSVLRHVPCFTASNCLLQVLALVKKYGVEVKDSANKVTFLNFKPESSVARSWNDPLHLQDQRTDPAEWSALKQPVETDVKVDRVILEKAGTLPNLPFIGPGLHQSLKIVEIIGCRKMRGLQGLAGCKSLTILHLTSLPALTNESLLAIEGVALRSLEISACPCITKLDFLPSPSSLKQLHLDGLPELTDEGLLLAKGELESLNISSCPLVSKLELFSPPRSLKQLHLDGLPELTDEGLPGSAELVSLESLDIRGCPLVTKLDFLSSPNHVLELAIRTKSPKFDFSPIRSSPSLKKLFINGPIDNLDFLHAGMKKQMKYVYLNALMNAEPLGPEALPHLACLPWDCSIYTRFKGIEGLTKCSPSECRMKSWIHTRLSAMMTGNAEPGLQDAEGDNMVLVSSSSTTTGGGGEDERNTKRGRRE